MTHGIRSDAGGLRCAAGPVARTRCGAVGIPVRRRPRVASAAGRARTVLLAVVAAVAPPATPPLAAQVGNRESPASDSARDVRPAAPVGEALAGLDEFVAAAMSDWHVPGLAVGVIVDGEIVLAKGYGYRDLEKRLPVTERTNMPIGSNSKSFTVTVLAMLADEGRLDWDRPVRDYLPDFRLYDHFATAEMTPRDLVTHQSGLPRHDYVWYGRPVTRAQLFDRLRHLKPNASFRSRYQYQNLMFMAAGHLAERITGTDWHRLVDDRILTPLAMERSNTSVRDDAAEEDRALPYVLKDGTLRRIPFRDLDHMGPALSVNSNVVEMLSYIRTHLDGGAHEGRRIISEVNSALMQQPQFAIPGESRFPELGQESYGLGLRVGSYRGRKMVAHGGGIDGFISSMSWLPRERIGVIVLTNRSGDMNPVPDIVAYNLYDRLLGLSEIDWTARHLALRDEQRARSAETAKDLKAGRVRGTQHSRELAAYAGRYHDPAYGTMSVRLNGGRLEIAYDGFRLELEHYHYDIFIIRSHPDLAPVTGLVTFTIGESGEVAAVAIPFEPSGADIVFAREDPGVRR